MFIKTCVCNKFFYNQRDYILHLSDKSHTEYVLKNTCRVCDICYTEQIDTSFIMCVQCNYNVCSACIHNIVDRGFYRCPFCRKKQPYYDRGIYRI